MALLGVGEDVEEAAHLCVPRTHTPYTVLASATVRSEWTDGQIQWRVRERRVSHSSPPWLVPRRRLGASTPRSSTTCPTAGCYWGRLRRTTRPARQANGNDQTGQGNGKASEKFCRISAQSIVQRCRVILASLGYRVLSKQGGHRKAVIARRSSPGGHSKAVIARRSLARRS